MKKLSELLELSLNSLIDAEKEAKHNKQMKPVPGTPWYGFIKLFKKGDLHHGIAKTHPELHIIGVLLDGDVKSALLTRYGYLQRIPMTSYSKSPKQFHKDIRKLLKDLKKAGL